MGMRVSVLVPFIVRASNSAYERFIPSTGTNTEKNVAVHIRQIAMFFIF